MAGRCGNGGSRTGRGFRGNAQGDTLPVTPARVADTTSWETQRPKDMDGRGEPGHDGEGDGGAQGCGTRLPFQPPPAGRAYRTVTWSLIFS